MIAHSLIPCPWCGTIPVIEPTNPAEQGNCWGRVRCINSQCPANPSVNDGVNINDERGSEAYILAAIRRWNTRAQLGNRYD